MTRFVTWDRATKRKRRLILSVGTGLALALVVWQAQHHTHDPMTVFRAETASPGWIIRCTERTWHGKPVYQLINTSEATLQRVTIWNWSKELLPVVHVGPVDNRMASDQSPLSSPPYDVPSHQSLWFVGSIPPPAQFIVEWQVSGQHHHAYLNVTSSNHFEQHPVWQGESNALH
jgi:hypothetical protein